MWCLFCQCTCSILLRCHQFHISFNYGSIEMWISELEFLNLFIISTFLFPFHSLDHQNDTVKHSFVSTFAFFHFIRLSWFWNFASLFLFNFPKNRFISFSCTFCCCCFGCCFAFRRFNQQKNCEEEFVYRWPHGINFAMSANIKTSTCSPQSFFFSSGKIEAKQKIWKK